MYGDPFRLAVIIGSVREGRFGPTVANWFVGQARQRQDLVLDVIDLAEIPLPPTGQAAPVSSGEYASPHVLSFASRIGAADAFVVVTPEYNHGYPGPLKIAIDSLNPEWHAKPVGFVSYGGISGGLRSVEQLRAVFAELHAVTIRETVSFTMAHSQFDEDGEPRDTETVNFAAKVLLDQIAWWACRLRESRAAHPYGA
ncbi:NADPH-dependent FMN reductase [Thermomonospora umbrina]|uniref:NAD(P)H-dependent FMN reductase n=1 Tax=Thermomonospora umbrina TaxID=111806 RepID=A0A3D9SSV1_9ACTN|nr:NAD(P)H-dependent oxidoreductase [Thermomonospora umbrina]REE99056.1 NAD(P)H-dependent FMN reductase [Thermomonospora umbrina]